jgi:hypothetical protein
VQLPTTHWKDVVSPVQHSGAPEKLALIWKTPVLGAVQRASTWDPSDVETGGISASWSGATWTSQRLWV